MRGRHGLGHVFLHHAAVAAGAGDLVTGDPGLCHRLLGRGRIFDIGAGSLACGRGVVGFALGALFLDRSRSGRGTAGARGHLGQLAAGLDGFAFALEDLGQGAGLGRGHLDGDLVGFQLAQHLVGLDAVAFLLEPGGDGGLGHGFTQGGDHDLNGFAGAAIGRCVGLGFLGFLVTRLGLFWAGAAGFRDIAEQGIDAHGFTFLGDDVGQGASGGRGDLDRYLVGFQLAQHFVHGDGVTGFLEPGGDGGLGDAFAEGGHTNFGGHGSYFPSMVSASSTRAACWALCWAARPVAGEAVATRPV